jgi:hypothetical protein
VPDLVTIAALNNAHLYSRVCFAHGVEIRQTEDLFEVVGTPPRFYSNAVTLSPAVRPAPGVGWGMKDSFFVCEPEGCSAIFEADWIARTASPIGSLQLDWQIVKSQENLLRWLKGWGANDPDVDKFPQQFPSSLLQDESMRFVEGLDEGQLVAGCLLNHSEGAIGVSNVFRLNENKCVYKDIALLASHWIPDLPLVGYERGEALELALESGFGSIGKLRVWMSGS